MSGFSTARQKMVDGQVRTSDVTDSRILDAMLEVPREAFVPEGKQALTYLDLDLDVSAGGNPKRCLIKPVVTAKLMQAAEIKQGDKVLVVGAASGYAAALVAKLAGLQTDRITLALGEIDPAGIAAISQFLRAMIDRDDPDKVLETIFASVNQDPKE